MYKVFDLIYMTLFRFGFKKTFLVFTIFSLLIGAINLTLPTHQIPVQAAQSTNLETNMTSYVGSSGEEIMEASAITKDNTVWFGGAISDMTVNYGKTPIDILGGGPGVLLHYASDGTTLKNILRFPSAVKDISADKNADKIAIIGAFGLVYMDTTNYNVIWSKTSLPFDNGANAENYVVGTYVDIGTNGDIASLYSKRIMVWSASGTNLTGTGNTSFSVNSKIIADIALVDGAVVVIGETQKQGGACVQ